MRPPSHAPAPCRRADVIADECVGLIETDHVAEGRGEPEQGAGNAERGAIATSSGLDGTAAPRGNRPMTSAMAALIPATIRKMPRQSIQAESSAASGTPPTIATDQPKRTRPIACERSLGG